jgi:large subunit ribosomal protein L17
MRHRNKVNRLRRDREHRGALVRNLLTSLFLYDKIKTTDAKARVLSQEVEKLFTLLKRHDQMNQIRFLKSVLFSEIASKKVIDLLLPKYAGVSSGYTRLTKIGFRKGDNATVIQVELI